MERPVVLRREGERIGRPVVLRREGETMGRPVVLRRVGERMGRAVVLRNQQARRSPVVLRSQQAKVGSPVAVRSQQARVNLRDERILKHKLQAELTSVLHDAAMMKQKAEAAAALATALPEDKKRLRELWSKEKIGMTRC